MRKSTRIVKRIGALFLVVLMSINTLGAVVSDNDGSAFITKAEFDSLKNNFQSQIDQYNTSIDSKIDGAIASYLAGISVEKTSVLDNLFYDDDGIYAAYITSEFDWKEGDMKINIQHNQTSYSSDSYSNFSGQSFIIFPFKSAASQTPFKNLVIRDINGTTSARWDGLYDAYESITGQSNELLHYGTRFSTYQSLYYYIDSNGWKTWQNSTNRWSNDSVFLSFGISRLAANPYNRTGDFNLHSTTLSPNQTFSNGKFKNIILTATSLNGRFNNGDQIPDFMTDNTSGVNQHTLMVNLNNGYTDPDGPNVDSFWQSQNLKCYYINGGQTRGAEDSTIPLNFSGIGYSSTSRDIQTFNINNFYKPYFGFSQIYNFNKLYLTKYDNLVNDIVLCHEASNVPILSDENNKKHLNIVAGAPIIKQPANSTVKFDVKFQDNEDHYIWFRKGPFTVTYSPNSDSACAQINSNVTCTIDGSSIVADAANKSFTIPATKTATITIKNDNDETYYLFTKWSLTNNEFKGGGTFLPSREVLVTSY